MKEVFAIVASVFAIMGNISYVRDVFAKKVIPHPYTWLVWSMVSGITFFGQVVRGAGVGAIPTGIAELFTILIFLFSLRYGFSQIRKIDTYFLIFALVGIGTWILTSDPTISVIIAVGIDLIAFVPTLRKTRLNPKTETPTLYGMNVLRHGLTLMSLESYNIVTTLHSLAMVVVNGMMTVMTVGKKK